MLSQEKVRELEEALASTEQELDATLARLDEVVDREKQEKEAELAADKRDEEAEAREEGAEAQEGAEEGAEIPEEDQLKKRAKEAGEPAVAEAAAEAEVATKKKRRYVGRGRRRARKKRKVSRKEVKVTEEEIKALDEMKREIQRAREICAEAAQPGAALQAGAQGIRIDELNKIVRKIGNIDKDLIKEDKHIGKLHRSLSKWEMEDLTADQIKQRLNQRIKRATR